MKNINSRIRIDFEWPWLALGVLTSLYALIDGTSTIPAKVFWLVFGVWIGLGFVFNILRLSYNFIDARYNKKNINNHALEISNKLLKLFARAIAFLLGSSLVSAISWRYIGSSNALGFTLQQLVYIFAFSFLYVQIFLLMRATGPYRDK